MGNNYLFMNKLLVVEPFPFTFFAGKVSVGVWKPHLTCPLEHFEIKYFERIIKDLQFFLVGGAEIFSFFWENFFARPVELVLHVFRETI